MARQQINFKNQRLDVVALHKGKHSAVEVGPLLRASGWRGGQFVKYITVLPTVRGNTGRQLGVVEANTASTIKPAGFLLAASTTAESDDPEFFSSYKAESTGVATVVLNEGKYKFYQFTAGVTDGVGYALNAPVFMTAAGVLTFTGVAGTDVIVGTCFHIPASQADWDNSGGANLQNTPEDFVGVDLHIGELDS